MVEGTDKMVQISNEMSITTQDELIKLQREYGDIFVYTGKKCLESILP